MLMRIDQLVKSVGIGKLIRRSPALTRTLGYLYYGLARPPYFSSVVETRMGGRDPILLDYRFGHFGYEHFGDRHNAGFAAWIDACRNKKVVFDIGAHIGLYSLVASRVLASSGRIQAFEPSSA